MLTPEQSCLLGLARTVWSKRAAAKRAGLPYNEETLTENMLLDLKLAYPGPVVIVPFSKAKEAEFGADWAWAFISADGAWSVTMLVQAKRLDDRERDYKGIKRRVGIRTPPVRQIDQLIATAANYGIPPVYAFYNHLGDSSRVPQRCGSHPSDTVEQIEGWGISLASAHDVAPCLPDESFATHSCHSIALHCMLCTRGSGRPGPMGSPGSVANAFSQIAGIDGPSGEGPGPEDFRPRQVLHPIIALASELEFVDSPQQREAMAEALGKEFAGVAGAVILRDAEKPKG